MENKKKENGKREREREREARERGSSEIGRRRREGARNQKGEAWKRRWEIA